jgi:hypothetical protein
MDAKICDRCKKVIERGKDATYQIVKDMYGPCGNWIEKHHIDLCSTCNEKFNMFLKEVDDNDN